MGSLHLPNSAPRHSKALLVWAQRLFLLIAIACLGYFGYAQGEMRLFQSYESWRLEQIQRGKSATWVDYVGQWIPLPWSDGLNSSGRPSSKTRALPNGSLAHGPGAGAGTSEGALIGKLSIPRVALSAIVLEGVSSSTLRLAVGHLPGTALPGENGNVDLAAHRDTFFRSLRNVQQGDSVKFSTTDGKTREYIVDSIAVVSPNGGKLLDETSGPGINLITCYPFDYFGAAPKRFVVHADEVGETKSASLDFSLTHHRSRRRRTSSHPIVSASIIDPPALAESGGESDQSTTSSHRLTASSRNHLTSNSTAGKGRDSQVLTDAENPSGPKSDSTRASSSSLSKIRGLFHRVLHMGKSN